MTATAPPRSLRAADAWGPESSDIWSFKSSRSWSSRPVSMTIKRWMYLLLYASYVLRILRTHKNNIRHTYLTWYWTLLLVSIWACMLFREWRLAAFFILFVLQSAVRFDESKRKCHDEYVANKLHSLTVITAVQEQNGKNTILWKLSQGVAREGASTVSLENTY